MKVRIEDIKYLMELSLQRRGLTKEESLIVVEPFIEAELRGKKTHGICKFFLLEDAISNRRGSPKIIKDKFNYALIDAQKELGYISAQYATDVLIEKAEKYDNGIVSVINSYYYSIAGIYAEKVSKAGFISIILNNGGPAAVVPYGGIDPIFGTNPIAIGIPFKDEAIVLDMSTSEKTWGEINLAKIEKRKLHVNTFLDKDGNVTTDPEKVNAVLPFGGIKGSGLNFMIEILTGAFVGAKMGLQSSNGYHLGFLFMAFSPEMFTTKTMFEEQVEQLIKDIKKSRKHSGVDEIYLPGERSTKKFREDLSIGEFEIDEDILTDLYRFVQGGDIKHETRLVE